MFQVMKKQGKLVNAYELGKPSPVLDELMAAGKIKALADGRFEIFSLEAVNGHGEIAQAGDFVKLDSKNSPYPNKREFFLANHRHVEGDLYEQLPKALWAWTVEEPLCQEIRFLMAHKGLVLDEGSQDKYFTAPLWGTVESAARDAVLVFYAIERDEAGEIKNADFNFVEHTVFADTYNIVK